MKTPKCNEKLLTKCLLLWILKNGMSNEHQNIMRGYNNFNEPMKKLKEHSFRGCSAYVFNHGPK